jgi:hypothetical protein
MAYQVNIWKIELFDIAKAAVGEASGGTPVFHIAFEDDEATTYIEVASPPATAMEVVEELFKVFLDDDQYAGITNTLEEIDEHKYDILVGEELVPYGEFEHLYQHS